MRELIDFIARALVDSPDAVQVTVAEASAAPAAAPQEDEEGFEDAGDDEGPGHVGRRRRRGPRDFGSQGGKTIQLKVAADDLGKVIGKKGRTAKAMRSLLAAAASKTQERYNLEIVE